MGARAIFIAMSKKIEPPYFWEESHLMSSEPAPLEILHTLGISGKPLVTPMQGGFDMVMWKVEHEGQTSALRVFRAGAHEDC